MNRIFGTGLHQTGTPSLGLALQQLGYRTHANAMLEAEQWRNKLRRVCREYDAFQNVPWLVLYRWLGEEHPSSKFILTVRPEKDWIDSVCRRVWRYGHRSPCVDLGRGGRSFGGAGVCLAMYRLHNREMLDYFGDRPGEDLLVMDITKGGTHCPFLGDPVHWFSFPRGEISED